MKNIHILDCTLRDGGRIINCAFTNSEITGISRRLAKARIDIIEMGFLRDCRKVDFAGNSTFFTNVDQVIPYIERKTDVLYVAFIDYGMFDIESLKPYDDKSIDGIRLGFTKQDYLLNKKDILYWMHVIKERGYKLFVQGVNTLNYSDRELLEIVDMVNEVHPYSFGIVDTYGAMYIEDVDRIYSLIDNNMLADVCINFHSHNNYQLSFSLAQEVIKLSSSGKRRIIIDSTLSGMGKVAGNLSTELIVNYLIRKFNYDYDFEVILDTIDDYIRKYAAKYSWGYSIPAMMAGIYKSHPNNVIYLTEKHRLEMRDIGQLLSMIDPDTRQHYDYDNIEKLYIEYMSSKVDDYETIEVLGRQMRDRQILILSPGNNLNRYSNVIQEFITQKNPVIISVSFYSQYEASYCFFCNQRKFSYATNRREGQKVIITSNVKGDYNYDYIINYHSLINRGYKYFENSTVMLLNLLKRVGAKKIAIAGFDGYSADEKIYFDDSYVTDMEVKEFGRLNDEITDMVEKFIETVSPSCYVEFLTPSLYDTQKNYIKSF